jgi:hypothetical protein
MIVHPHYDQVALMTVQPHYDQVALTIVQPHYDQVALMIVQPYYDQVSEHNDNVAGTDDNTFEAQRIANCIHVPTEKTVN